MLKMDKFDSKHYNIEQMKQNASVDASFWINICEGDIILHVDEYFQLYVPSIVAEEIRYPLDILGFEHRTVSIFNDWVENGKVVIQNPLKAVDWFQVGENAAIALALERNYFLLIDDANPYHRAKSFGLKTAGSTEIAVLLYDKDRISFTKAMEAIKKTHASRKQKRQSMIVLERLKRVKG
jgi:predicted nucleic acid-binding protein